jgi:four helix bundle protein
MRNFRTLNIWQQGIQLVVDVYKLSEELPNEEKYGLKSQICRAAVSIPSNIAEGSSRPSEIEYRRFLEIALGSAFELETQLIIIQNLQMASNDRIGNLKCCLEKEQKMINSLISRLKQMANSK